MLHKFRNFVIPTRKKTLTVFFHTIFPSESFGRSGFSTVWVFRPLFPAEQAKGRDLKDPAPALGKYGLGQDTSEWRILTEVSFCCVQYIFDWNLFQYMVF